MSIIGVVADNLESYPADLLKTLLFLQKTSSCTDCILVSNEGTPVHAHLVILSLSWPALDKLLPPSAAHCDCLCCVLRITVAAETKTIELLVELAYTGMTGLVGLNEEVKVKHLLQALGLEWVLEREEIMPEECNNNEMTDKSNNLEFEKKSNMPIKDLLEKGLLLSSADAEDAVGALFDYSSESYLMYGESYRRKSIPRGAKSKMLDDKSMTPVLRIKKKIRGSAQSKPLDPVKDSSKEQGNVPGLPEEVLAVIPVTVETKEFDSSNVEKTSPLIKVLPTVVASIVDAPQNMKMIAPGTLMTTAGSSVRFFCSHCEEEITKYSKAEKEAHWAVAHFSDQLSQFVTGQACNICNFQVDSVIELIKHVAITHKKIYSCLSGLPPSSGAIAKETVAQSIPHLFTSRTVTVNPNNKLDNPFVFIKCVLQNLPSSVHHSTTAFLEERSSNIQSVSPLFPTTSRHWYYTGSSSNNNPDSPVLSSLACHYSSLLGEEDSAKCSYCPHKKYQHARTSLHQSVEEVNAADRREGEYWCELCHQELKDGDMFHHHLATHFFTIITGTRQEAGGQKDAHVVFSPTRDTDPLGSESEIVGVGGNADPNVYKRCRLCDKVFSKLYSLKRHIESSSSHKDKLEASAVLNDSGIVFSSSFGQ